MTRKTCPCVVIPHSLQKCNHTIIPKPLKLRCCSKLSCCRVKLKQPLLRSNSKNYRHSLSRIITNSNIKMLQARICWSKTTLTRVSCSLQMIILESPTDWNQTRTYLWKQGRYLLQQLFHQVSKNQDKALVEWKSRPRWTSIHTKKTKRQLTKDISA